MTALVWYNMKTMIGPIASDIKCSMYPPIETLMDMIADNDDRRPIVLIEYAYQIANSSGHFELFNYRLKSMIYSRAVCLGLAG